MCFNSNPDLSEICFIRRSTLTFMTTFGKEKVNIVAAGLVSIIYCIQRSSSN